MLASLTVGVLGFPEVLHDGCNVSQTGSLAMPEHTRAVLLVGAYQGYNSYNVAVVGVEIVARSAPAK